MRLYKTAQILETEPIYDLDEEGQNIHSFYPDDTTAVKADWFSGIIVTYTRIADHKKDLNGWEYTFQEGKLIDEKRKYVSFFIDQLPFLKGVFPPIEVGISMKN